MEDIDAVRQRFSRISGALNERLRRLFAATEAEVLGYGGVSLVARATGVSRRAITEGLAELRIGVRYVPDKTPEWIRRPGGGRKKAVVLDATLQSDLESLIEPLTRGDPESPLRWTCQSLRQLAPQLWRAWASSQPYLGGRTTAQDGLQSSSQPEDQGGWRTPGPQCTVRVHQCAHKKGIGRRQSRHLGRHQEEGVGWRF